MKRIINAKIVRIFLSLLIIIVMMIETSMMAFAQVKGTETWSDSSDESAYFIVYDDNTTPYKTVSFSGPLYIWIEFYQADECSSPIEVTFKVTNLTQKTDICASTYAIFASADGDKQPNIGITVNEGDVLQFYMKVDTETGYAKPDYCRSAKIRYGYSTTYGTWVQS